MRVALDTSVLVAALVSRHPHHERAEPWLKAVREGRLAGVVAAHGLAELWATLTAAPLDPRVSAEQATRMVDRLREQLEVVTASTEVYLRAMRACARIGARSGAIFDALHYVGAQDASAKVLLTFNARHFTRFESSDGPAIHVPPDPPAVRFDSPDR